ncbi:alpha-ribazole phosphatase [Dictyobacter vulcani]|uniref:Alpha-ribazole phosphatase n=1 Tax=Dictyobacter vulcani TaxID=2607529 RepID=A0A5J4KNZ6_9CHLR|nr:histidine phosphatase family protein [Dictyobacter vulcani]GER91458.1 alpha-ribazole phosphatase [Dictyobacter vulcani]
MNNENRNTIYLIRHGENPANLTHDFSYKKVDYSLTPKGRLQAQQTAEFFQHKQIDEVYASPLKRAQETAQPIASLKRLPITLVENFREIHVGSLEGRPPTEENWNLHNRIVQDWVDGKHSSTFPDGENYISLIARMRAGLHQVTAGKSGKKIVVVGHGGIFTRTIKDICPDLDMAVLFASENYNCSITEIEILTTDEQVIGTVTTWASYAHLYGEAAKVVPGTMLIHPATETAR